MKNTSFSLGSVFVPVSLAALLLGTAACGPSFQRVDQKVDNEKALEQAPGPEVPTLESALLTSAKEAEQAGQFRKAAQFYTQLADKNPSKVEYHFGLAEALRKSGGYPEAISVYNKIIEDKDFKAPATEGIGLAQMAQGEYERAGDQFSKVMEMDAARWKTINAVGILFTIKGMYDEARQYFAEGVALEPKSVSIRNNMALMEAMDHQYDESLQVLRQALEQPSINAEERKQVSLNMALIYAIKGDLKMAESTAEAHLTKPQLLNNMGYYAHLANDENLAKSYLNMALMQSPAFYDKAWKNLEVLERLASQAPGKGKSASTVKVVRGGAEEKPAPAADAPMTEKPASEKK